MNIKVGDFIDNFNEVQISDEASKTFGRRIKLLLCTDLIKNFVKNKNLNSNDILFDICPSVTNRYLKRLAIKVLRDKKTLGGGKTSELTMYDFRHSSACFWLPRYKTEAHLKYRFGWKRYEMVHYYTELLGMRDNISQEDLLIDETRSLIEKKLEKSER